MQADDGRNLQAASDDRGVAGGTADVGDKADDVVIAKADGVGGRQIVSDDDHLGTEMCQVFAFAAQQVAQQPLLDVDHVVRSLRHVLVLQVLKNLGIPAQCATDGVLRRILAVLNQRSDLVLQACVTQHLMLSGKDRTVLLTELHGDILPIAFELL